MNAEHVRPGSDPNVERLPPTDRAAEMALIGAVLVSAAALDEIVDVVTPDDFYKPEHAELFAAFLAVRADGRPVDHLTVASHLGARLYKLGGGEYLVTCMQGVVTAANARYHAEIVAEKAARRRLLEVGVRIQQLGYADSDEPTADLVLRARSELDKVPAGARSSADRQLRETLASDVVMRRLRFLWQDRIVLGALNLLAGREGLGKSTIAVDIAAQVTRGELPGEMYGHPRWVIYVNSEDARDVTIVPRLVAAGADLDRIVFLDAVSHGTQESPLVLPLDIARLEARILARDAVLVVLDAATSAIDGSLDGDRDRQMRQGLEPITQLAARTGCSVLGIVHFGKRESADTGKLILGSIAWSQVARAVIAVARDDETGQLVVSNTKANLAPGDAPSLAAELVPTTVPTNDGPTSVGRVRWLGETDQRAQELLAQSNPDEDRSDRAAAAGWLEDFLTEAGRSPSAEVKAAARKADISERTLQRARQKLRVVVVTAGFPRISFWSLPDFTPSAGPVVPAVPDDVRARERGTTGTTGLDQGEPDPSHASGASGASSHVRDTTDASTGDR